MAPAFSKPMNGNEIALFQQRGPPPIPFKRLFPMSNAFSNTRDSFRTITLRTEPNNEDSSTFEQKVRVFADGTTEDYVRWRIAFDEVVRAKPLTTSAAKVSMANVLLIGAAKDLFANTILCIQVDPDVNEDDAIYEGALEALNRRRRLHE